MSALNIYQRMAAITAELQTVAKNLNVETGKGKGYKAVSERDVIDAVKPLEAKHGVYSYPASRRVLESAALESESEWNGKVTKKTTFFERIETVYRFVNTDDPTDFIETTTFAEGIDSQDKGSGKAMTYAFKYMWLRTFALPTGEDPDKISSAELDEKERNAAPVCERCGSDIVSVRKRNGEMWTVKDMVKYYKGRYGAQMCADCMKAAKKEQDNAAG